ncbi:LytTR family DNA-binding domain-containing protein [Pedobacter heparinus]|uniref:LytR/AlgR family response regulator transcription factor n=1 Tax=Pedobacter heparinus TaxID=984 RepID=UPI002931D315|nr:LytTR family DNA-binding domain-containing protein [Pedobacter heparinus]
MTYRCIIIDDEPHFTELLEDYIASLPQLELIKTFHNPARAMLEITNEDLADIIFLDINMPHMSGIELAPYFKEKCRFLIFVTAHSQYAVNAFELEADDFLHKPFRIQRLEQAIKRIARKKTPMVLEPQLPEAFFVRISSNSVKYRKFVYSEIVAFESDKNNIIIYTPYDSHRVHLGLNDVEHKLNGRTDFIKVHRSFIISKDYIQEVEHNTVTMKESRIKVSIGKNYKEAFLAYMENHKF